MYIYLTLKFINVTFILDYSVKNNEDLYFRNVYIVLLYLG